MGDFVLSSPSRESRRHQQGAWVLGSPSRTFLNGFSAQLTHPYRTMILRAMETVVSGHIGELHKDKARAIILLASSEMTRAKVWAHLHGLGREASSLELSTQAHEECGHP